MKRIVRILAAHLIIITIIVSLQLQALAADKTITDSFSDIEEFVDGFFDDNLAKHHVPGAALAIVRDDRIILSKGYGYADLEKKTPVDPSRTLFKIASVSKLLTATAVMQMVEKGELELKNNINNYLKEFKVEEEYDSAVTLEHLLTHTAGFTQMNIGSGTRDRDKLIPLEDYLKKNIPMREFEPGRFFSYSNQGISIAAYMVEKESGTSFGRYVEDYIFKPLSMENSSFDQLKTPDSGALLASGYGFDKRNGLYKKIEEFYHYTVPAGGCMSTVNDMANFIVAHLNNGVYKNKRILKTETVQHMQKTHFRHHPAVPGQAYGFWEGFGNGRRALFHTGTTDGYANLFYMLPEDKIGFMLSYNTSSGYLREEFLKLFLDKYYPPEIKKSEFKPLTGYKGRKKAFEGIYWNIEKSTKRIDKMEVLFSDGLVRIKASDDGKIKLGGLFGEDYGTYVETSKDVFSEISGEKQIAFSNETGNKRYLFYGNNAFKALKWYENPIPYMFIGTIALLILLVCMVLRIIAAIRNKVRLKTTLIEKILFNTGVASSTLIFIFTAVSASSMIKLGKYAFMFGIPRAIKTVMIIPSIVSLLLSFMIVVTVFAWKKSYWNTALRILYTIETIGTAGIIAFNQYWNL